MEFTGRTGRWIIQPDRIVFDRTILYAEENRYFVEDLARAMNEQKKLWDTLLQKGANLDA